MRFWRISNFANLTGSGGKSRESRWNYSGKAVVYLADHPSTSLLEILVHIDATDAPISYQLLAIDAPDTVGIGEAALPDGWETDQFITQNIGTKFLEGGAHALLRVPSVVMPQAANFLLNPAHPDAVQIRITQIWRYPFDSRLLS
jgi:RES domain-containing protein